MCQISTNRLIVNCVCVRKCQSVRMTTCTFVPLSICPFIHLSACVSLCGHGQSVNRPFIYSIVESLKAFGYRAAKISRNQPNPPLLPISGAYIYTYIYIVIPSIFGFFLLACELCFYFFVTEHFCLAGLLLLRFM